MSSTLKIPAAMLLLTILLLGALFIAATPQSAFGAKYWGDTAEAGDAHDDLRDDQDEAARGGD